jgi:hypothetical protein
MTRWTAAIPQALHRRADREFSARHDQEPQALALVPLRRTVGCDWTLIDGVGNPVEPNSMDWVGTVEIRRPGAAAGRGMYTGTQWLWTARVDQFLVDPPSPGAALVLWLLCDRSGGTLYRMAAPAAFDVSPMTATRSAAQASSDDDAPLHIAIRRAVGEREKFRALLAAALLTWP